MGWLGRIACTVVGAVLVGGAARAQTPAATDALEHGHLVIWVVGPEPAPQANVDVERATLHTSTTGNFGRTAGSVGQTAGSYGRSASTLPNATTGTAANEIGQTAGSFGESLSTLAAASMAASGAAPVNGGNPMFEAAVLGRPWERLAGKLRSNFAELQLTVVPVSPLDLRDRLLAIGRGVDQPDVLLSGTALPARYPYVREVALSSLGERPEGGLPAVASPLQPWTEASRPVWAILAAATHPEEARAFAVWLQDGQVAHAERQPLGGAVVGGPASVAVSAVESALHGGEAVAADPEMARMPAGALLPAAFTPARREDLGRLGLRVDVLAWAANERFAVYGLRVIAGSGQAFGVAHPMVVLRRGDDQRWRVLQISANLAPEVLASSFALLRTAARAVQPELVKAVAGVTLASPPDGDSRAGMPELWWDNPGDARLLAVEWQTRQGDTRLMLLPDTASRLQVRVTARFANLPGLYRWRVWAIGTGGVTKLSPWRQLTVLP